MKLYDKVGLFGAMIHDDLKEDSHVSSLTVVKRTAFLHRTNHVF